MNFTRETNSGVIFGDQETLLNLFPVLDWASSIIMLLKTLGTAESITGEGRQVSSAQESQDPSFNIQRQSTTLVRLGGRGQWYRPDMCVLNSLHRCLASCRAKTDKNFLPPSTVSRIYAMPHARSQWAQNSWRVGDWSLTRCRNQIQKAIEHERWGIQNLGLLKKVSPEKGPRHVLWESPSLLGSLVHNLSIWRSKGILGNCFVIN